MAINHYNSTTLEIQLQLIESKYVSVPGGSTEWQSSGEVYMTADE